MALFTSSFSFGGGGTRPRGGPPAKPNVRADYVYVDFLQHFVRLERSKSIFTTTAILMINDCGMLYIASTGCAASSAAARTASCTPRRASAI